jgi:hypothetical protein
VMAMVKILDNKKCTDTASFIAFIIKVHVAYQLTRLRKSVLSSYVISCAARIFGWRLASSSVPYFPPVSGAPGRSRRFQVGRVEW